MRYIKHVAPELQFIMDRQELVRNAVAFLSDPNARLFIPASSIRLADLFGSRNHLQSPREFNSWKPKG
jgi:hypothetical protein